MSANRWKCELFADGYCRQLEAFAIRKGRWRMIRFPALMALLEHPSHGPVLFDAGYSQRFFAATRSMPYTFYRWLTPVTVEPDNTARAFLARRGITGESLEHLVLSHFHADHMGGLRDFPEAAFYCTRRGFDSVAGTRGLAALRHAFLPDLMPDDFHRRAVYIEDRPRISLEDRCFPFTEGWDLFADRSLIAIDLPGHATGQIGLFFEDTLGRLVFLVSDACWSRRAFRQNRPPSLLGWLPQADRIAYRSTLEKLHRLHLESPEIRIIPTHCDEHAEP